MLADTSLTGVWVGGAIGAGGALLTALLTGWFGLLIHRQRLAHETELARTSRLFEARRQVYAEALALAYRWCDGMFAVVHGQELRILMDANDAAVPGMRVLVAPFATTVVREAVDAVGASFIPFFERLQEAAGKGDGVRITDHREQAALRDLGTATLGAVEEMGRQINKELTGVAP